MLSFNIPADFQNDTIDKLSALNAKYPDANVTEVYGNLTTGYSMISSGRARGNIPEIDLIKLEEHVAYARKNGIEFNYTLNATTFANREFSEDGVSDLKRLLQGIHEAGVRTVIIALPPLFEIVRSTGLDFKIKASVLCQITTPSKALKFRDLGATKIVPDESINRDFAALRRICSAFGDQVELIANPYCNSQCQYRMFHYNQLSCETDREPGSVSNTYYSNRCLSKMSDKLVNMLLLMWIRPEDLKHYQAIGITHFKLQGRHNLALDLKGRAPAHGDLVRTVEAYLSQDFVGDLSDLIFLFNPVYKDYIVGLDNKKLEGFLKPFIEKDNFCTWDCESCKYCHKIAERVIDPKNLDKVHKNCQLVFGKIDEFQRLVGLRNTKKSFP